LDKRTRDGEETVQDPGCHLPVGSADETIQTLITRVKKLLNDIPASNGDFPSIDSAHIGDLQEIHDRLTMLIASISDRNSRAPDG
jgi:hypothetical protein